MIDLVFPDRNEKEFIKIAETLNIKGLCFVYSGPQDLTPLKKSTKLKIYQAILCTPATIQRHRKHFTIMECPADQAQIRTVLEQHRPDVVFNLESASRRDFIHHRASGLNQVHAALAKKNKVIVAFDFETVLKARSKQRAVIMGRASQNISFARKFKFQTCFATFAHSPYSLRPPQDLKSFYISLGMHTSEAESALKCVYKRLETHINP